MLLYTALVARAIGDMTRTVPELGHIDPCVVAVLAAPRAGAARSGNLAQCCALCEPEIESLNYWYRPGSRQVVRVTPWFRRVNTRVEFGGRAMRYIVLLRLPRMLSHEPVETIVHELLHIGPRCDGRLRRMRHGRRFDAAVGVMAARWRAAGDPALVEALDMGRRAVERWGPLVGAGFSRAFSVSRAVALENAPPIESHPDFRRLGLRIDPARVEVAPDRLPGGDGPAVLTERDVAYRAYEGRRTARVSASALCADRALFPPGESVGHFQANMSSSPVE